MTWFQGITGALQRDGRAAEVTLAADDQIACGGQTFALSAMIPRTMADVSAAVRTEAGMVASANQAETPPPADETPDSATEDNQLVSATLVGASVMGG